MITWSSCRVIKAWIQCAKRNGAHTEILIINKNTQNGGKMPTTAKLQAYEKRAFLFSESWGLLAHCFWCIGFLCNRSSRPQVCSVTAIVLSHSASHYRRPVMHIHRFIGMYFACLLLLCAVASTALPSLPLSLLLCYGANATSLRSKFARTIRTWLVAREYQFENM